MISQKVHNKLNNISINRKQLEKTGPMLALGCAIRCTARHGLTPHDFTISAWYKDFIPTKIPYRNFKVFPFLISLHKYNLVRGACPARDFGKLPIPHHNIFEGVVPWRMG